MNNERIANANILISSYWLVVLNEFFFRNHMTQSLYLKFIIKGCYVVVSS